MAEAAPSRSLRLALALDRAADRPWLLPAVALFPAADYVLPVLPNQLLLAALSMLRPARWWRFALAFVAGAALGAGGVAAAVETMGPWLLDAVLGGAPEGGAAARALALIEAHGLWALALLAALPWPPRTAVILCALAGLPPLGIALAVAVGRLLPGSAYAYLGAKAPHLLRRNARVDRLFAQIEACRIA